MRHIWLMSGLLLATLLVTSSGRAFHENGVRTCHDGEMGYIAILMSGEGVVTFLSSEDPPKSESILCQIAPAQLIQVKAQSQGL